MARVEMGNEAMSANLATYGNFFMSRFGRSLVFYGVAWLIGAILLNALHFAFSSNHANSAHSSPAPIARPAQSLPAEQPGRNAGVAGAL